MSFTSLWLSSCSPPLISTFISFGGSSTPCTLYRVFDVSFFTMIPVDVPRERGRAPSRPRVNLLNLPSFAYFVPPARLHQGQSSLGAVHSSNVNIRQRLQRSVSSIRSFFKSRTGGSDICGSDTTTQGLLVSPQDSQAEWGPSTTIIKNPLRLHQDTTPPPDLDAYYLTDPVLLHAEQQAVSPDNLVSRHSSIRRKLSTKLLNSFQNSATVVVKPELRARPSVYAICNARPSASSSCSWSHSSTSTTQHNSSTPPTSDGMTTGTPGSILRHEPDLADTNDQLLFYIEQSNNQRQLSTIEELGDNCIAAIKTIEATAAAK